MQVSLRIYISTQAFYMLTYRCKASPIGGVGGAEAAEYGGTQLILEEKMAGTWQL